MSTTLAICRMVSENPQTLTANPAGSLLPTAEDHKIHLSSGLCSKTAEQLTREKNWNDFYVSNN